MDKLRRERGVLKRKPLWILPAFLGGDRELASSRLGSRNCSPSKRTPLFPLLLFLHSQWLVRVLSGDTE